MDTPSDISPALRAKNLRTLGVLAAIFLVPLVISFWLYYGTVWRPVGRVNHGQLINPPRPLSAVDLPRVELSSATDSAGSPSASRDSFASFHNRWTLVYIGRGDCGEACRQALYFMRQTRLSLNNDMTRVERVFLVTGDCCARERLAREQPGLVVLDATDTRAAPLLTEFPASERDHTLFVVDPLGNLMMSYDDRQNPKGLLEDLKTLLKLSHIG